MTNVAQLPNPLERLAAKIAKTHERVLAVDADWIEASLQMCSTFFEARQEFLADRLFSDWLKECHLDFYAKDVRVALIGFGSNLVLAREVFTQTGSRSYDLMWREHKGRFRSAPKPDGSPGKSKRKSARQSLPQSMQAMSRTEIRRQLKLGDVYARVQNTSLGSRKEQDALIELFDHFPEEASKLVEQAVAGEGVSAVAICKDKERDPLPTVTDLKNWLVRNSHVLLSGMLRASPETRREFIRYLEETYGR
jgi:hypothetical protein